MIHQSTWKESVSFRSIRMGYPLEHFIGYSLVCADCDRPFRCFRELEPWCGVCRGKSAA